MTILTQLNAPPIYLICGGIIAFVAVLCVIFLLRAWRAGLALGMDKTKMKRAITSSATFSLLPSVGILLGVIALSGAWASPGPGCACRSSAPSITRPRWPRRRRSRWAWAPCPRPR